MNPGKLKDRCKVMTRVKGKTSAGQLTYQYNEVAPLRGNFREMPSKDVLALDIQVNTRSGTCMTRYFPGADESQFMQINEKHIYRVLGFNHDDDNTQTIWALEYLKAPYDA